MTRIVIEARSGWQLVDWHALWRYRELLGLLAWRDIQVRYKQTVLGALWAVLQPLLTMAVFSLFFGRVAGLREQVPGSYPLYILAALLPWQLFSTTVGQAGQSLVAGGNLLSKVYFPRLIIPIASAGSALADFAVSLVVMLVALPICGVTPGPQLLLLPVFLGGTLLVAIGVGTLLAALVIEYRDFRFVLPFLLQIWMFASPIFYPPSIVADEHQALYGLNPLVGMISGFRSALLGTPVEWTCCAVSGVVSLTFLGLGLLYFRRLERRFADLV